MEKKSMTPNEEFKAAQKAHCEALGQVKLANQLEKIARNRMVAAAQKNNAWQQEIREKTAYVPPSASRIYHKDFMGPLPEAFLQEYFEPTATHTRIRRILTRSLAEFRARRNMYESRFAPLRRFFDRQTTEFNLAVCKALESDAQHQDIRVVRAVKAFREVEAGIRRELRRFR